MKNLLIFLMLAVLIPSAAFALPTFDRMKTKLNQNVVPSDGNLFRLGDQLTGKKLQVLKLTYDVSRNGGSVASHALEDVDGTRAKLPANAVVKEAWIDIRNTVQSNAAFPRLCFTAQSQCDLKGGQSSQAFYYAPGLAGATNFRKILPVDGTTVMKMSADRVVYATVTGGALTGGTMNLFIEYFLSD